MGRVCKVLAVAALASISTASIAQVEQTPAGAREFLSQVLSAGNVSVAGESQGRWNYQVTEIELPEGRVFPGGNRYKTIKENGPPNPVRSVIFNSDCKALLSVGRVSPSRSHNYGYTTLDQVGDQSSWDITKLAEATAYGSQIRLSGMGRPYQLTLPSEALATRAAFAFNFLRQACDPTAATGF